MTRAPAVPAVLADAIIGFGLSTIEDADGVIVVEWLRQPEVADGRCRLAAESFARLLEQEGVAARAESQDDEAPPYSKAWGYDDRVREPGWGSHWVTVVEFGERVYTVDFTASQFGYPQFPLVQRLVDGEYRRL